MRMRPVPAPVYALADPEALAPIPLPEAVASLAEAGVRWIQIRAKRSADADLYRWVAECLARLEGSDVVLWVDDRADIASLLAVPGLHLGQEDLPPEAARRIVGQTTWIGLSTHNADELAAADADPDVDLVALGPVFPTSSKERPDPVVGLDAIRRARRATTKPLVAIGGIDAGNIASVLEAGADAAAVLGALAGRGGVAASARRLLMAVEGRA